jgi:uncharacterized protein
MTKLLSLLAKRIASGQVKTRLAKTIGNDMAVVVYTRMLQRMLDTPWNVPTCVYWTGNGDEPQHAGKNAEQPSGDLGDRMKYAFERGLEQAQAVAVIGTDCPELQPTDIARAFWLLESHDVVIGPTKDGGYCLIACKVYHPELFEGMPWSTSVVFQTTLKRCRALHLSVASLVMQEDIDEWSDLVDHPHREWLLEGLDVKGVT